MKKNPIMYIGSRNKLLLFSISLTTIDKQNIAAAFYRIVVNKIP